MDDDIDLLQRNVQQALEYLNEIDNDPVPVQEFREDEQRKIFASNTQIILHIHKLMKGAMTVLFWGFSISILFVLCMLGWMIFIYVYYTVNSALKLEEVLEHIWTVLSGAFIVVFFQFIISLGQRISNNDNGSNDSS